MPTAGASAGPPRPTRYGQAPLPATFDDAANAGLPLDATQVAAEARSRATTDVARRIAVPRLIREAIDRGWWSPARRTILDDAEHCRRPASVRRAVLPRIEPDVWARLTLAPRVDRAGRSRRRAISLVARGRSADGAAVAAAVEGDDVVGLAITRHADDAARSDLLAVGVAPAWRRRGLATQLLATRMGATRPGDVDHEAVMTVAERDPVEPLESRCASPSPVEC